MITPFSRVSESTMGCSSMQLWSAFADPFAVFQRKRVTFRTKDSAVSATVVCLSAGARHDWARMAAFNCGDSAVGT
jgi:hypothetical protein